MAFVVAAGEAAARNIILLAAEANIRAGGAIFHWPFADLTRSSPQACTLGVTAKLDMPIADSAMASCRHLFMTISWNGLMRRRTAPARGIRCAHRAGGVMMEK